MQKLTRDTLYSLEEYAEARPEFRAKVLQHKKNRALGIGAHATLYFEDFLTMKYQVQEMLRIEKIFEKAGIEEELDAYNPLVPDGCNWKATFMIEYGDVEERRKALERLVGIEDKTWMQVEGFDKVYAIADEDLERTEADKTSAVHFMRFELTPKMASAAKQGAAINGGIDHEHYNISVSPIPANIRDSLSEDLD
jgi:hypothetical protein